MDYCILASADLTVEIFNQCKIRGLVEGTLENNTFTKTKDSANIVIPVTAEYLSLFQTQEVYSYAEMSALIQSPQYADSIEDLNAGSGDVWADSWGYHFGSTDKACSGLITTLNSANKFSIRMKVKWNMAENLSKYLMGKISGADKIQIQWINSQIRFFVGNGYVYATPTRANKFYDIVCTFDGTQVADADKMKIYIDGTLMTTFSAGTVFSTIPSSLDDVPMAFASRSDLIGSTCHDGIYSEINIFNDVLDLANVGELFAGMDAREVISIEHSYWFGDSPSDTTTLIKDTQGTIDLDAFNIVSGDIVAI